MKTCWCDYLHDPPLISLLDREGSTNDDSPSPPDALLKDQLHQLSVNKIHNSWSSGQFLFNRKGKVIRNYDQGRGWRTHNDEVDHKPFVCSPVATTGHRSQLLDWRLPRGRDGNVVKRMFWNITRKRKLKIIGSSKLEEWTSPNISGRCRVGWTNCQEVWTFTDREPCWRPFLSTAYRWKCNKSL